jgi:ELWxxDGT repeat protein
LVAFAGHDGRDGLQLWISDGTAAGSSQLGRIGLQTGSGAAAIRSLCVVGQRLFFVADDGVLGEDLWVIELGGANGAQAVAYGQSNCPGTGGNTPRISSHGLPQLGNAAFALDVADARPGSLAFAGVSFAPTSISLGQCRVLVAPTIVSLPAVLTDPVGFARTPLAIPAHPSYAGLQLFAQYAVLDPQGALLGGLALSGGLRLRLGL